MYINEPAFVSIHRMIVSLREGYVAQGKFVAYYRVSTDRQGASGLGLEAQQASVRQFLNGGTWTLLDEFVEIESGKRIKRPQLAAALEVCKKRKATLVIAKLDRLARNVHFISGLMESGVEFIAADNPAANKLMIHMLAAFAEHEREMISTRTRQALAAARERGAVLGGPNISALNAEKAMAADIFARAMAPLIDEIRRSGIRSVRGIAEELNKRGIASPRGARWHLRSVDRLLHRLSPRALKSDEESPSVSTSMLQGSREGDPHLKKIRL